MKASHALSVVAAAPVRAADAELLVERGRLQEAVGLTTRALRRPSADPETSARLRAARGFALWLMGDTATGLAELRRALKLARGAASTALILERLALGAWRELRLKEAFQAAAEARALREGESEPRGLCATLAVETRLLREAGRHAEALTSAERRCALAADLAAADEAAALADLGALFAGCGRWSEARVPLERAAQLYRETGDPRELTRAGAGLAVVALADGRPAAARSALEAARGCTASALDLRGHAELLMLLSDLSLATGEAGEAAERAAEALRLFTRARDLHGEGWSRMRRSHALLALGRGEEALREARRAVRCSGGAGVSLTAWAELALGRALLWAGSEQAAPAFRRALAAPAGRSDLAAAARLGIALAGGRRCEARAQLERLAAWGDRRILSHALADLRRLLGAGAEPEPQPGAPVLDAAEPARAVVDAALALARAEEPSSGWAEAVLALRAPLGFWRAALVGETDLLLEPGERLPCGLPAADLARALVARCPAPARVDLSRGGFADHPGRALHHVSHALVVPVAAGTTLYLDFRERPAPGADALAVELGRLLSSRVPETQPVEPASAEPLRFPEILGRCPALRALLGDMARVAAAEIPVHVFGETGTGKELVALALHRRSRRSAGPFVAVNASAIQDELFESELCGHVKGAFTGAVADRAGYLAEAHGGTLFLDEVADLSPRAQAKLLRLLEAGEYRRLGDSRTQRADVRVISAANARLEERVAEGRFREDLLYRLNAVALELPPLRERGADRRLLARHFARAEAERSALPSPALGADVLHAIDAYPWPGNVRELRGEMSRLVVLSAGGPLGRELLSPRVRRAPAPAPAGSLALKELLRERERELVAERLAEHAGNRARTAVSLGITRQALVQKLGRLGLA
jgi:two-component system, NtrC family, response regulator